MQNLSPRLARLWRDLFSRSRVERELDDERRGYQDMLADEKAGSGMNLREARRMAAVETGGIEQVKEQVREVRMGFSIDTLSRDVRFAARVLLKQRAFSLTVLSLLAIGVAGTTAIFSVFNGLFLRPLPYHEPEQLRKSCTVESGAHRRSQSGLPCLARAEPGLQEYRRYFRND